METNKSNYSMARNKVNYGNKQGKKMETKETGVNHRDETLHASVSNTSLIYSM